MARFRSIDPAELPKHFDAAGEFFELAAITPIHTQVKPYPLERANQALEDLRAGRLEGAAVLVVSPAD